MVMMCLKGPWTLQSRLLYRECPEDVMSTLEQSWPSVRVALTHTIGDFISDCQRAWFVLTPGHDMSHIGGNLIKSILYIAISK